MPYQRSWKICYGCTGLWFSTDGKDTGGKCQNPLGKHDAIGANIFYELYYFGAETKSDYSGAVQENWRCCKKCKVLFFNGNSSASFCHDGGSHDSTGSKNYILDHQRYAYKNGKRLFVNFRWCCKCQQICTVDWLVSLHFICPHQKGATHKIIESGYYAVDEDKWI